MFWRAHIDKRRRLRVAVFLRAALAPRLEKPTFPQGVSLDISHCGLAATKGALVLLLVIVLVIDRARARARENRRSVRRFGSILARCEWSRGRATWWVMILHLACRLGFVCCAVYLLLGDRLLKHHLGDSFKFLIWKDGLYSTWGLLVWGLIVVFCLVNKVRTRACFCTKGRAWMTWASTLQLVFMLQLCLHHALNLGGEGAVPRIAVLLMAVVASSPDK